MILSLPSRAKSQLKLGIGALFLPLLGLANSSQQLAGRAVDTVVPRGELLRQNEVLRQENQQLRFEALQAQSINRENARLRQLVGWQARQSRKLKLASVVLREPSNWWRMVQIDRGSRDGMTNNLPVLDPVGALVGRISSVSLTHSQVLLLGDAGCHVAALVEDEGGDTGVLGVSAPLTSGLVELGFLSKNANIKPGQLVKTSGLGGIFPKDILIGKIVDAQPIEFNSGLVAHVKLAADLDALEEVWVVLP